MPAANRRKDLRLPIGLPVRVQGHTPDGKAWEEMGKCEDASSGGAAFVIQKEVRHGQVVYLALPLPKRYRRYDPMSATYQVYGLVESVQPLAKGARIGVSFLGRKPPVGFDKNPGGLYAPERRTRKRGTVFLKVRLQLASGEEERTVLENYGAGGARVMTGRAFAEGEVVEIEDAEGSFRTRAEVRSIYVGKDGIRRINLRFMR